MVNNKKTILKESELIDLLSSIVTDVIKEQDEEIYLQDPGQFTTPSLDYQLKKTGFEHANSSPEQFVEFWHNRCMRTYGPVRKIESVSREAQKCFTSMPQTSRNYMTGSKNTNRRNILLLWLEKTKKILLRIDTELVSKMTHASDMSNFTADDAVLYDQYENWVASRFYKKYPKLRPGYADTWQIIEYVADAIGIVALFFGPIGWIVSGVAGLVSAFAMWQQGNKGGALIVGALELIPGLKLIKHFRHVKQFKRMDPEQISKGLTYFEEPTELAYKSLNKVEKELVDYTIKNPSIIKPLLKVTEEAMKAKDIIKNIKNMKQFWKFAKTKEGIKHGLDKIGWSEFQKIQSALTTSEKVISNVKNGIKIATPFVVGLVPALYAVQWAMYGANVLIFKGVINNTDDLITSAKLDNTYHYRYDRVINQKYPYNRGFNKAICKTPDKYEFCKNLGDTTVIGLDDDYTDAFKTSIPGSPPNILLLIKLWGDKTRFPEITPKVGGCVGVNLGEVANPGGGWRPNLSCLKDYNLNRQLGEIQTEGEELIAQTTEILEKIKAETITKKEAQREVGILLNLDQVEYDKIDFDDIDTTDIEYL